MIQMVQILFFSIFEGCVCLGCAMHSSLHLLFQVRLITMVFRICSTSTAQMVVAKDLGLAVISYVGATLLGICRIGLTFIFICIRKSFTCHPQLPRHCMPPAIEPGKDSDGTPTPYDAKGIFTGSVTVVDGTPIATCMYKRMGCACC